MNTHSNWWLRNRGVLLAVVVALAIGLVGGYWIGGGGNAESPQVHHEMPANTAEPTIWTCSMHPNIRLSAPGKCPICGMDLIPVSQEIPAEGAGLRTFVTNEAALALMDIQTSPVERRFVTAEVRMVGKVAFDETRLAYITAWVPGRIDRMYVDYTGVQVRKGDHMVTLYSPEILTAQEELRRAARAVETMRPDAPAVLRQTAATTLDAARAKLRRWGLTEEQVRAAEKGGTDSDHITIYAPIGGTVIERMGREGMYVETGTQIYAIAGLDEVWVSLDAYESDLPWIHYGQTVEFTSEAYPGEIFEGRIAFIDPVLNEMTRTVKVRVNVPNPDGRLKPEMFVRAVVRAQVATGGRVMDPGLAGKWISPMHPEIVKDGPGTCDICGMALVRAEDLGYVPAAAKPEDMPLVIPATAPLITGKRAIVYVRVPDADEPTFEGREIMLGPRAGDYYLVRSGLDEGEQVVTNGNFKIDSALQILAKPSMMTPEGGGVAHEHDHGTADTAPVGITDTAATTAMPSSRGLPHALMDDIDSVYRAYESAMDGVRRGDHLAVAEAAKALQETLAAVDRKTLGEDTRAIWTEYAMRLQNDAIELAEATDDKERRQVLAGMAENATALRARLGLPKFAARAAETAPAEFQLALMRVVDAYLAMQAALADDNSMEAVASARQATASLAAIRPDVLSEALRKLWDETDRAALTSAAEAAASGKSIEEIRKAFRALGDAIAAAVKRYGAPEGVSLHVMHCPMAFGTGHGADWLQRDTEVRNPYLGRTMLRCGEVTGRIQGRGGSRHG